MNKVVLVVNTHGIGDVIMTIPMLRLLHNNGYNIHMLVKSSVEKEVLCCLLGVHGIDVVCIEYSKFKKRGLIGLISLYFEIRKLSLYAILPTFWANEVLYNALSFLSGAKVRVGLGGVLGFLNTKNYKSFTSKHKVDKNIEIAEFFLPSDCIKEDSSDLPVYSSGNINKLAFMSSFNLIENVPIVVLAPGSGVLESHKRWPISKYSQLARKLLAINFQVVVLGGPGEEHLGATISENIEDPRCFHDLTGRLSIVETLDFLHLSSCVVANCNGLSHMAASVQTPVIGLYGPTDPYLTGPYSDCLIVVKNEMQCAPCYNKNYITGCGNPICMSSIDVEPVFQEVKSLVNKG